ncbi:Protein of unknown function [Pyronema omphalodes CBS 100304]|uniref:Uncharacterized protein n=1 Tax=Pyronema omphalodes (strain CBS 100304) TaxID=1076935 RepID=U4LA26_PYROM|nr:Protein of unknown function [Pyronema omphalodes CBS 100304]
MSPSSTTSAFLTLNNIDVIPTSF